MQAYLARRLIALIPALFFASLIVFVIVRLVPGSIIDMMLAQNDVGADKLSRDQLVATLGLDRPMWQQYFTWIGGILLHGDFGRSLWQNTPVRELLGARLPITFQLGFMALIVALCTAIPIGIYSAIRQDTAGDYLTRSFSILMLAVPSFWMGTMVMVFPSIWWGWSPQVKFVAFTDDPLQNLRQMILPAVILGTALSAVTMRLTRTMMLEVLRQDYIRTAWAKGLSDVPAPCSMRRTAASRWWWGAWTGYWWTPASSSADSCARCLSATQGLAPLAPPPRPPTPFPCIGIGLRPTRPGTPPSPAVHI